MTKILPIVVLAMLAGCGQSKATDNAKAAVAPAAPHSYAQAGTFMRTNADGSIVTEQLQKDGTYTYWIAGAPTESGKWAVKDNKTCFTPDGGKQRCAVDSPMGSDGTFTETPEGGAAYQVEKNA